MLHKYLTTYCNISCVCHPAEMTWLRIDEPGSQDEKIGSSQPWSGWKSSKSSLMLNVGAGSVRGVHIPDCPISNDCLLLVITYFWCMCTLNINPSLPWGSTELFPIVVTSFNTGPITQHETICLCLLQGEAERKEHCPHVHPPSILCPQRSFIFWHLYSSLGFS